MPEQLSDDTNATLLLCAALNSLDAAKPLRRSEYNQLGRWLYKKGRRPSHLMDEACQSEVAASGLDEHRLRQLMGRGIQLGFCVEEWQRSGVWVLSRSDLAYPERLKRGLKGYAPPLLFGVGPQSLLNIEDTFAIVGPDKLGLPGKRKAKASAGAAMEHRWTVITTGRHDVSKVVTGAVNEAGGVSIRVLADGLIRSSVQKPTRRALSEERLVLVSPFSPNVRSDSSDASVAGLVSIGLSDSALYLSGIGNGEDTCRVAQAMTHCSLVWRLFVWIGGTNPDVAERLCKEGAQKWSDDDPGLPWQVGKSQELFPNNVPETKTPEIVSEPEIVPDDREESESADMQEVGQGALGVQQSFAFGD